MVISTAIHMYVYTHKYMIVYLKYCPVFILLVFVCITFTITLYPLMYNKCFLAFNIYLSVFIIA